MQDQFLDDKVFPVSVINTQMLTPTLQSKDNKSEISLTLPLSSKRMNVYNTLSLDEKEDIENVALNAVENSLDRISSYELATNNTMKRKLVLGFDPAKKHCIA